MDMDMEVMVMGLGMPPRHTDLTADTRKYTLRPQEVDTTIKEMGIKKRERSW